MQLNYNCHNQDKKYDIHDKELCKTVEKSEKLVMIIWFNCQVPSMSNDNQLK